MPLKSQIRGHVGTASYCPEGFTLHSLEVTPKSVQGFPTVSIQIFDILLHSLIISELHGGCWFSFKVFAEQSKLCSGQQILFNQGLAGSNLPGIQNSFA